MKISKLVTGLGIGAAALGVVSALFSDKAEKERIDESVADYFNAKNECDSNLEVLSGEVEDEDDTEES